MRAKSSITLIFLLLLGSFGHAFAGDTATKTNDDASTDNASTEAQSSQEESTDDVALVGDSVAGEARYKKTCINCHGAAGKGVASYPKVSGQEISYTTSKLNTYREGTKIGPNSSLMIMMAKPLTDQEIADLAAYLKEATP